MKKNEKPFFCLSQIDAAAAASVVIYLILFSLFTNNQQNGYPSRRRSLVDDARFETLMVKQTKESVLEEAREKANGKWNSLNDQISRWLSLTFSMHFWNFSES